MLRTTLPSIVVVDVRAVKGKPGVRAAPVAEPKFATRSSPGCVVVRLGVEGAAELPCAPTAESTRFVDAIPAKSAALTSRVEYRLAEKVTVILSPACSAVAT